MENLSFSNLNLSAPLLKAVEEAGYISPTTIQSRAFPVIMSGRDVCGIAQTGTGKTWAYLLPCIRQMSYSKTRLPQMLVLVPTRELVVQVVESARALAKYTSLEIVSVYGGVNMKPQMAAIENGLDILVATPGRLYDLILNGTLRTKQIKKLVIDEMDEMLDLGFRTQLRNIMDLLPAKRQNLLFSATLTDEVEAIMDTYFEAPVRIEAAPPGSPLKNIRQTAFEVPNFYTKVNLLKLMLERDETMEKVMVFTASKKFADRLLECLQDHFPEQIGAIHSNKAQNHRFETIRRFKEGTYRIVIATDIVARGIDISEVSHVVNFDLPEMPEHYVHRIGRTGRADKKGIALSFVTEKEKGLQQAIESLMGMEIEMQPLPDGLEISTESIPEELPTHHLKEIYVKPQNREGSGAAFHEKHAKNKKMNHKVSHKDKMMAKYGKKKTRPPKNR